MISWLHILSVSQKNIRLHILSSAQKYWTEISPFSILRISESHKLVLDFAEKIDFLQTLPFAESVLLLASCWVAMWTKEWLTCYKVHTDKILDQSVISFILMIIWK